MNQLGKKAAGKAAADLIQSGMTVGLGSGSTATYFIQYLTEKCHKGLKIKAVASSKASHNLALKGGVPLLQNNEISSLDITVDGADEIDRHKRMIKGGGGALLREKILASISDEMVVIVDESKVVPQLGSFPLPVEISPFAHQAIVKNLTLEGFKGQTRTTSQGLFLTDNGNYIFDICLDHPPIELRKIDMRLKSIPGVIETGFFFDLADRVLVGHCDGSVDDIQTFL